MKTIAIVMVAAALSSGVAAQDKLAAAKDQYAAAAYEDALASLSHVEASGASGDAVTHQVEEYRAFCLYALGRTGEAEQIAESLLTRAPLLEIDDTSPRIEAMFAGIRKRLLPSLIRSEYRSAKAAIEEKDFASARPHLVDAERMLEEARKIGVWDDTTADLSLVVDGFLDLTRAVDAASPRLAEPRIYSADDTDVVPVETISTAIMGFHDLVQKTVSNGTGAGVVYVVIDEQGHVEHASIRESINARVDKLLIDATRSWRFRPATRNGVPVKYAKIVLVNVR